MRCRRFFSTNKTCEAACLPKWSIQVLHPLHISFVTLFFAWLHAGCIHHEPNIVPVEGRVLLDGKSIEGAAVLFHPPAGGRPAVGITDDKGTFVLTSKTKGDGAHLGMNTVAITKEGAATTIDIEDEGNNDFILVTPPHYASPERSGITIHVQPDMEPVVLNLTTP